MRRPQSAFGLAAVTVSLVVVTLSAMPAAAAVAPAAAKPAPVFDASSRCTKWRSQYVPPRSVRVLRTKRDATSWKVANTVEEVDFSDYVAVVMAVEWPEHYPKETLRAGAVATKQYAWYHILHWRGGTKWVDGQKQCYDVVDTWADQVYYPEKYGIGKPNGPGPRIQNAIADTWNVTVRKFRNDLQQSRLFLTGYRAGASRVDGRPIRCGEDATGYKLFHNSTVRCGKDGLKWREILRRYLSPNLEIVEPGHHDLIGTRHGDATAVVLNKQGQWVTHAWPKALDRSGPGAAAGLRFANDDLAGYRSADLDGDGHDDLVWFRKTGPSSGKINVALSTGKSYGESSTWWEGDSIVPTAGARLLVGDFQADGRIDVALLGKGDEAGKARLVVFRRKGYNDATRFADPSQHWHGGLDHRSIDGAWAGDISGDGRADLIVRQDPDGGGVRIKTSVTRSPLPSSDQRMYGLKTRWERSNLKPGKVRTTVGDANRDGRDDVIMLIGGRRARVLRLQGLSRGGFKLSRIWTAPKSDPIPARKTRLGVGDVDFDGRSDLIFYIERNGGTHVRVLKLRYDRAVDAQQWQESSLPWSSLRPY